MNKKEVGLFSGSFNPIHVGHLMMANYVCEFTRLEEVWFVVTPHNPLKESGELLDDELRLQMVRLALEDYERIYVSDVEFHLPRPSYTIDTVTKLRHAHPDKNFTLIIGEDNWTFFNRWKAYQLLIDTVPILIYPRLGETVTIPEQYRDTIQLVDAPIVEVSSTFIRRSIREKRNMRAFVPAKVYDFIEQNGLYR